MNNYKFNPEMLQLARELRELTQTELARRAEMTQAFVSMVESGVKDISEERIRHLADVLQFPKSFFYQLERYSGLGLSLVFYRKKASAQVGDLRRLQAEINIRRIQIGRLVRGLNITTPYTFHKMDIDDHDGEVESIAQMLRANWNLPLGPINNLTSTIERAGGIVCAFPFGTRDVDAISQWPDDSPPFFFINTEAPSDRVRFSLAHELGHVIMHSSASETMENEADRFASEFLMPAKEIGPQLYNVSIKSAAAMKPYWRVSIAAIIRRARDLEKIPNETYSDIFRRMSQLGLRRNEPGSFAPEKPALVNQIIEAYQKSNGFSLSDLAQLTTVYEPDFVSRYLPRPNGFRLVNN